VDRAVGGKRREGRRESEGGVCLTIISVCPASCSNVSSDRAIGSPAGGICGIATSPSPSALHSRPDPTASATAATRPTTAAPYCPYLARGEMVATGIRVFLVTVSNASALFFCGPHDVGCTRFAGAHILSAAAGGATEGTSERCVPVFAMMSSVACRPCAHNWHLLRFCLLLWWRGSLV
jgi:hypothetical protein